MQPICMPTNVFVVAIDTHVQWCHVHYQPPFGMAEYTVTPAVPGLSPDSFTLPCYQSIPDSQSYTGSPGIILG